MSKFHGVIGYGFSKETAPGVYKMQFIEKSYGGDILRFNRNLKGSDKINDDVEISNSFSIVADPWAFANIYAIKYIEWMGTKWKVSNISVEPPRLVLSIGGIYNAAEN